ncbi:MAG: hypothetical protein CSA39_01175 [Flavobacteriales bacterium]|nr:MAG: hypothetical protein CR989_00750 [Flavobacteriales bacterium]PIE49723.1 MAG: hypothetical protein CSA39_01175 [Flavobacteriales bacterium]
MKTVNIKPKLFLNLFLIIGTLTLLACSNSNPTEKDDPQTQKPTKEMLSHLISTEKAIDMHQNYLTERISLFRNTLKKKYGDEFEDTRKIWLSLPELKNYIAYVEQRSKEQDITPEGLLFYLSVSTDKDEQKDQQTFFIAPTTKENDTQSGYTLEDRGGKPQVVFLKKMIREDIGENMQQEQGDMQRASFSINLANKEDGLLYNKNTNTPPASYN